MRSRLLIGMGSRHRSASQAIHLPSDGGVNLERLFTSGSGRVAEPAALEARKAAMLEALARSGGWKWVRGAMSAGARERDDLIGICLNVIPGDRHAIVPFQFPHRRRGFTGPGR